MGRSGYIAGLTSECFPTLVFGLVEQQPIVFILVSEHVLARLCGLSQDNSSRGGRTAKPLTLE